MEKGFFKLSSIMNLFTSLKDRRQFFKAEPTLKVQKVLIKNRLIQDLNLFYFKNLQNSKSRIKNGCVLTGRSRSVYRGFKVSRFQLKILFSTSKIRGFKKASW